MDWYELTIVLGGKGKIYTNNKTIYIDPDEEIITKYNLNPKNILMVGNDVKEDGAIQQLGVDLYLVDDFLLNKYNNSLHLSTA